MYEISDTSLCTLIQSRDRRSRREGKDPRVRIQGGEDMRARIKDTIQMREERDNFTVMIYIYQNGEENSCLPRETKP